MPRTGLAYDDVADAIHSLDKAGLTPSIRLIREKLGKGSLSTIAEHKRAFDANQADGPGPALPDPIAKQLLAGAQAFWSELVEAAEAQIRAAEDTTQATVDAMSVELDEAKTTAATLQDALGERDVMIERLEKAAHEHAAEMQDVNQRAQAKDVELAGLVGELKALQAQHDETLDDLRRVSERLSRSESECASLSERLEQQAARLAKEKADLQQQFSEYKERLVTVSDEYRQERNARNLAEKAATAAEQQAAGVEREIQHLARDLVDAREEARVLTETLGGVRGEHEAAQAAANERLAERDARLEALEEALKEAQALVRQYVDVDRGLVQELIDERRAQSS
ncbi:MAG: hypothetical protein HKN13_07725 [Rhodothermales bacterium]|nr:hypothetical protein [Rhodothermales bacterium]